MYNAVKSQYGWPDDPNDQATGLRVDQECQHSRNRSMCLWFKTICDRVEAEVMKKSMWDVAEAAWPGVITYGNYDEMEADGEMDKTGWMYDRPSTPAANADTYALRWVGNSSPTRTYNFPRGFIEPNLGGFFYHASNGRYLVSPRWTGGNVDMPRLYGLPDVADWGGYGHQSQTNQYLPPGTGEPCAAANGFGAPCETFWEATMRINRHTAESIINSGPGQRNEKLVPWLEMAGTIPGNASQDALEGYRKEEHVRAMLAMLRGKNIKEGAFWINYGQNNSPGDRDIAWYETALLIEKVYAARVSEYAIERGSPVIGEGYDAMRLEYTLLEHLPNTSIRRVRAASVRSAPIIFGGNEVSSELKVEFIWPSEWGESTPPFSSYNITDLHINVECSTTKPGTVGRVMIGTPPSNGNPWLWSYVSESAERDANNNSQYLFHTNPEAESPFAIRTRRSFVHSLVNSCWFDTSASRWKTTLKLVHSGATGAFTSSYDLVQIIPGVSLSAPSGASEGAPSNMALISDLNYDGVSDTGDVFQYLDDWIEGYGNTDLNQDGIIDEADLSTFEQAYINGE